MSTDHPPDGVAAHLASWVGGWPPTRPVHVIADPAPNRPAWDGSRRGVVGVGSPDRRAVVRVPERAAAQLGGQAPAGVAELLEALPAAMGRPGVAGLGVLRWAVDVPGPDVLPDIGVWLPASLGAAGDPRVARWLVPFGGDVLVALDDDDRCVAGVGLKRHDELGREIAVVTEERARGLGLARRLVAQAARAVIAQGRVVTYLHAADNIASARVAEASGFPDLGWTVIGFWASEES